MSDSILNHSTVWPAEMVAKVNAGVDQHGATLVGFMRVLKSTPADQVEALFNSFNISLTPEEMSAALTKARPTITGEPHLDPATIPTTHLPGKKIVLPKAEFYAAAWMCGAALRQIGRVMGVSHQTVYTSGGRHLGPNPVRVIEPPLKDEIVYTYYREWEKNPFRSVAALVQEFAMIYSNWKD